MSPPEPSLRPFRAGFVFGGANALTWMIGLGTPMVLLAEKLGASALQVGLASSFVFLLLPLQVLSTAALRRLGYRRQMVWAWAARALFLLVPLALAWAAPERPPPGWAGWLVASVFGFCLLRAFGTAAHLPWFAAFLPAAARGRFFATDQTIVSLVGVATLLACAALLGDEAPWHAFVAVYGLAILGSSLAVASLARLPDPPPPRTARPRELWARAVSLVGSSGTFRHYLLLSLLGSVVPSGMAAFTAYYLRVEAGLPADRILTLTAAHYGGAIVGAFAVRRLLDRFPLRRFFRVSAAVQALVYAWWLAWTQGAAPGLEALLPAAFLVFGAAIAVQNVAHFTFLPSLADEDERPVTVAVFTAVLGVLMGLSPVAWGFALKPDGGAPSMDVTVFGAYFAVGIALALLLVHLMRRLPDLRR